MKKLFISVLLISGLALGFLSILPSHQASAAPNPNTNYAPGCYGTGGGTVGCPPSGTNDQFGNPVQPSINCYIISGGTASEVNCTGLAAETTKTSSSSSAPTCESSGVSLSWVFCPVINGITDAVNGINNNLIQPLLKEQPINLSNPAADSFSAGVYNIWNDFRFYGDIVLVLAILAVVFSEVIGGGLIDAYTARKMLPRILIAAILINLSIYLVAAMIDVANIVGSGIVELITDPFKAAGGCTAAATSCYSFKLSGVTSLLGLGTIAAGATVLIFAWGAAIEFLFVFVLLPAILAFVGALFTVVIRQGLIIFLLLSSPVAFALYALPNTEQYFKKWWNLLFITLMVYPIIETIFALAYVIAVTIDQTSSGLTSVFAQVVTLAALVLPVFMIPYAFKLAGGAVGSVHGIVTGLHNRVGSGIKGDEKDPMSRQSRARRGLRTRMNEQNMSGAALGTRLNPTTLIGSDRRAARRRKLGVYKQTKMQEHAAEVQANNPLLKYGIEDDKVASDLALYRTTAESHAAIESKYQAAMGQAGNDPDKIEKANQMREQLYAASQHADQIGRNVATRRAAIMSPAFISYGLDAGEAGWKQATGAMKELSQGDDSAYYGMINQFQSIAKNPAVGRADLAGNTDSAVYDGDRAWGSVDLYQHVHSKPSDIVGAGMHFQAKFNSTSEKDKDDAARFYKELDAALPNSTGGVRDKILEQRAALNQGGRMDRYLSSQVLDPTTGLPATKQVVRRDAAGREERNAAGQVIVDTHVQTKNDTLEGVRRYEPPDPNRM